MECSFSSPVFKVNQVCNVNEECTALTCEIIPIAGKCGRIIRGDWRPYECCRDNDCKDDQYCSDHNCEPVECVSCGYVYEHGCIEFECCNDDDCVSSE